MIVRYDDRLYVVSEKLVAKCKYLDALSQHYNDIRLTDYEEILTMIINNNISPVGDIEYIHNGLCYFGYDTDIFYFKIYTREVKKIQNELLLEDIKLGCVNFDLPYITEQYLDTVDFDKLDIDQLYYIYNNASVSNNWIYKNINKFIPYMLHYSLNNILMKPSRYLEYCNISHILPITNYICIFCKLTKNDIDYLVNNNLFIIVAYNYYRNPFLSNNIKRYIKKISQQLNQDISLWDYLHGDISTRYISNIREMNNILWNKLIQEKLKNLNLYSFDKEWKSIKV